MLKGRMLSDTHRTISALGTVLEDYIVGDIHSPGLSCIVLTMRKGNLPFSLSLEGCGN